MAGTKYGNTPQTDTARAARDELANPRRGRPPKKGQINPHEVAKKIQVSKLINVLEDVALGNTTITKERLKAIEILLRKAIPDLKALDVNASGEQKVTIEFLSNVKRKLDK